MSGAPSRLTVAPAVPGDLAAIMGIYNWAVNQTFATLDAEPLDSEEAKDWWDSHGSKSLLLVAEGEEGVIGWGRLLPWIRRGMSSTVEDLVYVDPLLQGQGVGKALLTQLIEEATGLGYRLMVAQVAADNRGGKALHEALGFSEVGVLHEAAHKFNVWIDITLMERPLGKRQGRRDQGSARATERAGPQARKRVAEKLTPRSASLADEPEGSAGRRLRRS